MKKETFEVWRNKEGNLEMFDPTQGYIELEPKVTKSGREMKLVYLASPYSHPDPAIKQERFETICAVQAELLNQYGDVFGFIGPIAASHCVAQHGKLPTEWEFWKKQDELLISRCDELWVIKMDGWEGSVGVQAEIAFAIGKKIPIHFLSLNEIWGIYD
jgi:hypothetical protein